METDVLLVNKIEQWIKILSKCTYGRHVQYPNPKKLQFFDEGNFVPISHNIENTDRESEEHMFCWETFGPFIDATWHESTSQTSLQTK